VTPGIKPQKLIFFNRADYIHHGGRRSRAGAVSHRSLGTLPFLWADFGVVS